MITSIHTIHHHYLPSFIALFVLDGSFFCRLHGIRVDSQEWNGAVIQKVGRTQHRPISTDCHDQIDIRQVLAIEFDPIDAGKVDLMVSKNAQQVIDTLLVSLVTRLQSFPSQCLGSLSS